MGDHRPDPIDIDGVNAAYGDNIAEEIRKREEQGRSVSHLVTAPPHEDVECFLRHLSGERRMLDVGCGPGGVVPWLVKTQVDYTGIDISEKLLECARERARAYGMSAKFYPRSYRDPQFPEDHFDGLLCSHVFSCEPKGRLPEVLSALRRILRPRGIMMVVMPEPSLGPECNGWVRDEFADPGELHARLFWRAEYRPTDMLGVLRDNGFTMSSIYTRSGGFGMSSAYSILVRKPHEGESE